ncbi:TPA: hypothetical protein ACGO1T_001949 [Streptococcus suis]
MDQIIEFLSLKSNKPYRDVWMRFILTTLRDKYFVNMSKFADYCVISRQQLQKYIQGVNGPTVPVFQSIYDSLTALYEPILQHELPQDIEDLKRFLDYIITEDSLGK